MDEDSTEASRAIMLAVAELEAGGVASEEVADALVILGANALVRLLGNQATADFLETLASELRLTQSVMIH
jgi:hypothetical protein